MNIECKKKNPYLVYIAGYVTVGISLFFWLKYIVRTIKHFFNIKNEELIPIYRLIKMGLLFILISYICIIIIHHSRQLFNEYLIDILIRIIAQFIFFWVLGVISFLSYTNYKCSQLINSIDSVSKQNLSSLYTIILTFPFFLSIIYTQRKINEVISISENKNFKKVINYNPNKLVKIFYFLFFTILIINIITFSKYHIRHTDANIKGQYYESVAVRYCDRFISLLTNGEYQQLLDEFSDQSEEAKNEYFNVFTNCGDILKKISDYQLIDKKILFVRKQYFNYLLVYGLLGYDQKNMNAVFDIQFSKNPEREKMDMYIVFSIKTDDVPLLQVDMIKYSLIE